MTYEKLMIDEFKKDDLRIIRQHLQRAINKANKIEMLNEDFKELKAEFDTFKSIDDYREY